MKIKKGDIVLTEHGLATVLYTENFRTADRAVVIHKTTPAMFVDFNKGVAYFYEEILEVNGVKTKLKADPWKSMSGDYINEEVHYCADYESDLEFNVSGARRCDKQCDYCIYNNR